MNLFLCEWAWVSRQDNMMVCGNTMVLFYWQLNFKFWWRWMKPQLWDFGILMPIVSCFLFVPWNVYLWKNAGIGVGVKHSALCSCFWHTMSFVKLAIQAFAEAHNVQCFLVFVVYCENKQDVVLEVFLTSKCLWNLMSIKCVHNPSELLAVVNNVL